MWMEISFLFIVISISKCGIGFIVVMLTVNQPMPMKEKPHSGLVCLFVCFKVFLAFSLFQANCQPWRLLTFPSVIPGEKGLHALEVLIPAPRQFPVAKKLKIAFQILLWMMVGYSPFRYWGQQIWFSSTCVSGMIGIEQHYVRKLPPPPPPSSSPPLPPPPQAMRDFFSQHPSSQQL